MADPAPHRAYVFDLDNTLTESKQAITPDMAKLLARLSHEAIVAVISGGMLEQLQKQVIDELPVQTNLENVYLLPTSGGALYLYKDEGWVRVYEELIPVKEASRIESLMQSAAIDTGLIDFSSHAHGDRIEYRGAQVTLSALGQSAPIDEKTAWDPDGTKRDTLRDAIQVLLPDYEVKDGGSTSIDVTKKGINKAYGIRQLSHEIGLPISDMSYIGDELRPGGNDEVVTRTGIQTYAVQNPEDTKALITDFLTANAAPVKQPLSYKTIVPPKPPVATPATHENSPSPKASDLVGDLRRAIHGDVDASAETRVKYSRDTSLFTRTPSVVVYPKNPTDVSEMVKIIRAATLRGENVSVTGRSAGTDMSGGPLTTSVVAVFLRYMNKVLEVKEEAVNTQYQGSAGKVVTSGYAITEPGVYYRDFEKLTLAQGGLVMPSYPASRELCAMGGIVNNNSGGERTLEYGKTEDYIDEVEVVLSDGSLATFKSLTMSELETKKAQQNLEGEIYRKMHALISENAQTIQNAKPKVSKNSAGYDLWNVLDTRRGTFNLAKLICGAQGTLSLMTKAKLRLVREETHRAMLVIFLKDIDHLPEIVHKVLPFNPESFESYDDQTFKLAIRFLFPMLSQMGLARATRLGISFLPEVGMVMSGGIPKLVLMAEFSAKTAEAALERAEEAEAAIASMHLQTSIKKNEKESEKYWIVRRESFALLRKNVHGMYASPFIDDFVVPPDSYPEFLPQLNTLLDQYKDRFIYTIAGHIGNGNFHIIPLMDLNKPETRNVVLELAPKVYELVIKYGGTTTGEHNDGIIRTPYLEMLFGEKMVRLFQQTKDIFDPLNIFNPGKKVGGTFADIERDMLKSS